LFHPKEVTSVVGDDGLCPGCDGNLGDHVVVRIPQKRPPQKVHAMPQGHAANVVDDVAHLRCTEGAPMSKHRVLVLENQRHRNSDFKIPASNTFDHGE